MVTETLHDLLPRTVRTNLQRFFCSEPICLLKQRPRSYGQDLRVCHAVLTRTAALLEYRDRATIRTQSMGHLGIVMFFCHNAREKNLFLSEGLVKLLLYSVFKSGYKGVKMTHVGPPFGCQMGATSTLAPYRPLGQFDAQTVFHLLQFPPGHAKRHSLLCSSGVDRASCLHCLQQSNTPLAQDDFAVFFDPEV